MTIYDAGPLAAGPLCGLLVYFLTFSGIFGDSFALFLRLFCAILGPEGPEAPVNGRSGRNLNVHFANVHFWF